MKLIIAGSRAIKSPIVLEHAFAASEYDKTLITEIVCGMAAGADLLGYDWADDNAISVKEFWPDWDANPRGAGIIRNHHMGAYGDAALILWDGESSGSASMRSIMIKLKKPVFVYQVEVIPDTIDDKVIWYRLPDGNFIEWRETSDNRGARVRKA